MADACGEKNALRAVSSNEVGVIVNPTVSVFPKVSFSINLAVFLASGPARDYLFYEIHPKALIEAVKSYRTNSIQLQGRSIFYSMVPVILHRIKSRGFS